jgi:2-polyprenyl-3-methyl-5-hydroxy-6-metoxy-1,4-benzoquinol methylase
MRDTRSSEYTTRLRKVQGASWKRYAPNPYRRWLRGQGLGFTLDIGCGLGRSLMYLDGYGVGVDHNEEFVETCHARGLTAFTPDGFGASAFAQPGRFDSLICMHVLEHLDAGQAESLLQAYLPHVRGGGKVVLVTPQELGFRSDSTHTHFVDGSDLEDLAGSLGLETEGWQSFPLPRWAGRAFIYNEFHLVARVPNTSREVGTDAQGVT